MDLEASLKFVEAYAKAYLHYILAFFKQLAHEAEEPPPSLDDGTLLIFSLMNAVVGAALQGLFVQNTPFDKINFPQSVIIEVCYWLSLCIVLHAVLSSREAPAHFSDAITSILSVAPVAFVIGSYSAFVTYYMALMLPDGAWAPPVAALINALVQIYLLLRYLRPAVFEIRGSTPMRKWIGFSAVILVVAVVHLVRLGLAAEYLGPPKPAVGGSAKTASVKPAMQHLARLALAFAIGLAALVGPQATALAQPAPIPATAEAPATPAAVPPPPSPIPIAAPGDITSGNAAARAWHGLGRLTNGVGGAIVGAWNRMTGRPSATPGPASTPAPTPSSAPPPRAETGIYVLNIALNQPQLGADDLATLTQAAQSAQLYESTRILIEMAGIPSSRLAPELRREANLVFEALAAANADRGNIHIDFRKGPRIPRGKIIQVSVYY
jgi:hypothetical protein